MGHAKLPKDSSLPRSKRNTDSSNAGCRLRIPSLRLLAIMDAPEADVDITLQKVSADLISDFDRFLPTFLRKPEANGSSRVRSRVRAREVDWATNTASSIPRP